MRGESEILAKGMMRPLEITDGIPAALGSTLTPAVAVGEQEGGRTSSSSSPEAMSTRRRGSNDNDNHTSQYHATMPDSPRSFDSNELFEDVLDETNSNYGRGRDRITDDDLERLMGNDYSDENELLDYRRQQSNNSARPSTSIQQQQCYHRFWSWMCPSFCHASGRRQQRRKIQIGNMIILSPYCVTKFNFGIMGPHWFGPVACLTLLTGATSRLVPRSYRTVGPITAQTCLGFYLVSVLLLGLVVCRDPGVVRATPMEDERDEQTSQIIVEDEGTDGVGRRVDVGSGGRLGRERGLAGRGRGSGGGLSNATRMTGRDDGWRYCDLCR
jgi:hypothetical protein